MKAQGLPEGDAVVTTQEGYDRWAEIYETDGNPLTELEEPVVREMLGDVGGLRVADIGCGTGRHSIPLAAAGAEVTAVDFSEGMLAKAKAKDGADGITFVCHDLEQPLPLEDHTFDRVICCLVLEHIQNVDGVFTELRRICRPGGFAIITAMHPAMMLIGKQACFRDPDTGEKIYPRSHPNQISDFVMASLRAGWQLEQMSELAIDEAIAERLPRAEKYLGWLMLFVMQLR